MNSEDILNREQKGHTVLILAITIIPAAERVWRKISYHSLSDEVDTCMGLGYLFTMFKKDYRKYNQAEREYWAQTKAQGKRRFILREMVFNIILWLVVTAVVGFIDRSRLSSARSIASTGIVMLPIFLLGGYLSGRWKWSDFERKYPE